MCADVGEGGVLVQSSSSSEAPERTIRVIAIGSDETLPAGVAGTGGFTTCSQRVPLHLRAGGEIPRGPLWPAGR